MDRTELITELSAERRRMAELLFRRRLEPLLHLDLSLQQLKIVLLVTQGVARTGRDLVQELGVSAPTVSASVDKLVNLGFLSRTPDSTDRRVTPLEVTDRGGRLLDQLYERDADPIPEALESLAEEDLEHLLRGTVALRTALEPRL